MTDSPASARPDEQDEPTRAADDVPLAPAVLALAEAVHEIEKHVSRAGWDGPLRVFALVGTARALQADPGLAPQLPPDTVERARRDPHHLTSVEQDELPQAPDLESLLARLTWPETVDGAAVVVERVVLPPAAEEGMPTDPDAALDYLMAHPDRQDVRLAVGALRTGEAWCAVRTRADDEDTQVAGGPDLVPGLLEAIRATFL